MTRKDYKVIAEAFAFAIALNRAEIKVEREFGIWNAIGSMVSKLQQDNPRFNEEKFTEYIRQMIDYNMENSYSVKEIIKSKELI